MANTSKSPSNQDGMTAIKLAFNDVDGTLSTGGFLTGKVGHKIELAISTTTVADDTETFTYKDNGTTLYAIKIIYTDGSRSTMLSSERIS